jgi:hypothetical protein
MGHVISLSEAARVRSSRQREPVPEGGATISLFLGVRYERWGTPADHMNGAQGLGMEPKVTQPVSGQNEVTTADVA